MALGTAAGNHHLVEPLEERDRKQPSPFAVVHPLLDHAGLGQPERLLRDDPLEFESTDTLERDLPLALGCSRDLLDAREGSVRMEIGEVGVQVVGAPPAGASRCRGRGRRFVAEAKGTESEAFRRRDRAGT
jgi:hypothetical protein